MSQTNKHNGNKSEKSNNGKAKDKPKEDKPKEDKPKEDKPKEDKPKDKPKDDKSKDKPKDKPTDDSTDETENPNTQEVTRKKDTAKEHKLVQKKTNTSGKTDQSSGKKTQTGSKKKRFEGVEKGDAPNAATAYINCTLNVNSAKNHLKRLLQTMKYDYGVMKAQYAFTAIAETLILYIIRTSCEFNSTNSEKANLVEITIDNLKNGVRKSTDLNETIKVLTERYNQLLVMDYTSNFFDTEKQLVSLIGKKAFDNTTNITMTTDVKNFLCYIISTLLGMLTHTACVIVSRYNKKNLKKNSRKNLGFLDFTCACEIHFSGSLGKQLEQRLTEIESLFANEKEVGSDGEHGENDENVEKNKTDAQTSDDDPEIENGTGDEE